MAEAKHITLSYEGKDYTLEFDRRTVGVLERRGFDINSIDSKPMTLLPMLFWGAFQKHHRSVQQDTTDKILKTLKKRDELFAKLTEMYLEPITTLVNDDEEDSEGNAGWETDW